MKRHQGSFWSFLFIFLVAISNGCDNNGGNPSKACTSSSFFRGFAYSPKGFPITYDKTPEFFAEVRDMPANVGVMFNGSWRDDAVNGSDAGQVPEAATLIQDQASTYCYTPVTVFGWRSGSTLYIKVPGNPTNNWTNTEAKNRFQTMLTTFASVKRPSYMFLGNENDFYYEQDPLDYLRWIEFYNIAYDAIKIASPATLVGPVFNFEHLSGNGALNGWSAPLFEALDQHDMTRVDVIGISLYPFFHYASTSNVPVNYLDPLFSRIGSKPIAVTETGWPAQNLGNLNPPWVTSEEEQLNYISKLSSMIDGKDVRFANWLFLHALQDDGTSSIAWKIAGSISLRNDLGLERPSYDLWIPP